MSPSRASPFACASTATTATAWTPSVVIERDLTRPRVVVCARRAFLSARKKVSVRLPIARAKDSSLKTRRSLSRTPRSSTKPTVRPFEIVDTHPRRRPRAVHRTRTPSPRRRSRRFDSRRPATVSIAPASRSPRRTPSRAKTRASPHRSDARTRSFRPNTPRGRRRLAVISPARRRRR